MINEPVRLVLRKHLRFGRRWQIQLGPQRVQTTQTYSCQSARPCQRNLCIQQPLRAEFTASNEAAVDLYVTLKHTGRNDQVLSRRALRQEVKKHEVAPVQSAI